MYIWQHPDWPRLHWQGDRLAETLHRASYTQGKLLGRMEATGEDSQARTSLDALLRNIITSSAIEGETLNLASVRSSLAKRLNLSAPPARTDARSEGLARLLLDATGAYRQPLTWPRLQQWHRWLFPQGNEESLATLRVGELRGETPMRVVSGRLDRPRVHFEAPPREGLGRQLEVFLNWFEQSRPGASPPDHNGQSPPLAIDPLLRAGLAHFWFVTLHPFEDGNGRLTRALTDLALAQADHHSVRLYAMSSTILEKCRGYYDILEHSQKGGLDITAWLAWFLETLTGSMEDALARADRTLEKARFWRRHAQTVLNDAQRKVLNRLLEGGLGNFQEGINATKYQRLTRVSKATATRHLTDLVAKGCLQKQPGGGRSTRYRLAGPGFGL